MKKTLLIVYNSFRSPFDVQNKSIIALSFQTTSELRNASSKAVTASEQHLRATCSLHILRFLFPVGSVLSNNEKLQLDMGTVFTLDSHFPFP